MSLKSFVKWFEDANIPLWAWLIELFVVGGVRFYIEGYYFNYSYDERVFIHALGYYYFIFSFGFMMTKIVTNEKVNKISSAFAFFTPTILVPPFIDYYLFGRMEGYPYPTKYNWAQITLSFFQRYPHIPSHGYQVEFGVLFFALFLYIYVKLENKRILEKIVLAASTVFTLYVLVLFLSTPDFSLISNYFMNSIPSEQLIIFKDFPYVVWFFRYFFLGTIFLMISAAVGNLRKIYHLIGDASIFRTMHFVMMYFLGFYLAKPSFDWDIIPGRMNLAVLLLGIFSSILGWFFIVGINNYYDREVDLLTNVKRGLPRGKYSEDDLILFSITSLVLGGFAILPLGMFPIIFYSIFVFLGFIYSYPPLYIKRFGVKTFFIGAGSSLVFAMGYFSPIYSFVEVSVNIRFWALFAVIFVIFSVGSVINDLKDYESDKIAGVKTIFTWLGRDKGVKLTSILLLFAFTFPVIICPKGVFIFPVFASIAAYLFYREKVSLVYVIYFAEYIALLFLL